MNVEEPAAGAGGGAGAGAGAGASILDARGLRCPMPVVRLAAQARAAEPGSLITVLWTDPAARHDVPAWARMRGHTVVSTAEDESGGATTVRLG